MYSNKANTILYLLLLGVISIYSQCKNLDCRETIFNFEIGIKAYPDKDSISVGDTIWLEVNEPTTLKDVQTGKIVDYSGASNLGTAISFLKLIAVSSTDDQMASKFRYVLIHGNEISRKDSTKYREFKFDEAGGLYRFKLGVIPKEAGVFKVFVSNAGSVVRKSDKCTKASFQINFKSTDQHLYLNEIILPGVSLSPGGGIYLFKVK